MKLLPTRAARVVAGLLFAAALSGRGDALANEAGVSERRSHVVARVESTLITVGDLETALDAMSPFQRASFGSTQAAVRRRFLTEVMVRDALLAIAADHRRLADQPPAAYQIERARSAATIRAIRARVGPAATIPMSDVERYYNENRARYDVPERYLIWRILCKSREEAEAVLDSAQKDPTPANFAALAREHSLDKATYLRAGNLGFITADGGSNEPGLRVDLSVVRAAQTVHDGILVATPVVEGEYFSVVWRRGTVAATKRALAEVTAQIRDTLWKARVKEETDKLVARLRAAKLRDLDDSLLKMIDLPVDDGGVPPRTAGP